MTFPWNELYVSWWSVCICVHICLYLKNMFSMKLIVNSKIILERYYTLDNFEVCWSPILLNMLWFGFIWCFRWTEVMLFCKCWEMWYCVLSISCYQVHDVSALFLNVGRHCLAFCTVKFFPAADNVCSL